MPRKNPVSNNKKHVIDASEERLGRVASEAACFLMGKHKSDFVRNVVPDIHVEIINTNKLLITPAKRRSKIYTRYSGYPGGLKKETLEKLLLNKGPAEALHRAIRGMLPANRLRKQLMKNLIIKN